MQVEPGQVLRSGGCFPALTILILMNTFSDSAADLRNNATVTASDLSSKVFNSSYLKRNDNVIVADSRTEPRSRVRWHKKGLATQHLVGTVPTNGHKVGNITQIILSDFAAAPEAPLPASPPRLSALLPYRLSSPI